MKETRNVLNPSEIMDAILLPRMSGGEMTLERIVQDRLGCVWYTGHLSRQRREMQQDPSPEGSARSSCEAD